MSFKYENARDAGQHLAGTIIMYAGVPAFVHEIREQPGGGFSITLAHLPRMDTTFVADLFSPDLEPRKMKLGYCNVTTANQAAFLTRIPARQYHQGLCRTNVNIPFDDHGRRVTTFEYLIRDPGFCDALRGVYPKLTEAAGLLDNPEIRSVAFNRYYAISKDELGFYRLYHRGHPVGFGNVDSFQLALKYDYLAEELAELGVKTYVKA